MSNNHQNPLCFSSNSSEIWGDDNVRMNSDYCNFVELQSSGFFRLVIATRFGRKVMLKTLKEEVKDTLKYKEILRKEFDILMSLNSDNIVNVITWEEAIIGNVVQASAEPNLFGLCRAQPTLCNWLVHCDGVC